MKYNYKTKGTCSSRIEFEIEDGIVHHVVYHGGCDGNLKAIPRLVEGLTVEQVQERLSGIRCGFKDTSCADQLARAVKEAAEAEKRA